MAAVVSFALEHKSKPKGEELSDWLHHAWTCYAIVSGCGGGDQARPAAPLPSRPPHDRVVARQRATAHEPPLAAARHQ
eukprot:1432839-Prymnesium_polylepis.1